MKYTFQPPRASWQHLFLSCDHTATRDLPLLMNSCLHSCVTQQRKLTNRESKVPGNTVFQRKKKTLETTLHVNLDDLCEKQYSKNRHLKFYFFIFKDIFKNPHLYFLHLLKRVYMYNFFCSLIFFYICKSQWNELLIVPLNAF